MSKPFNPSDWYWLKPDSASVYSSRAQTIIATSDDAFVAWSADGSQPTLWPRDEDGSQTDAALNDVLASYGMAMAGFTAVPTSVTSAQAKIQLRRAGLRDQVDAAIQAAGGEVLDWFTDARVWERSNPNVAAIGAGLKLGDADIDGLFIAASKIAA